MARRLVLAGLRVTVVLLAATLLVIVAARFTALVMGLEELSRKLHVPVMLLVITCTCLHMVTWLGRAGLVFASTAFTIGLVAELAGTAFGVPFGKYYYSGPFTRVWPVILGLVPLNIPIMWAVLAYSAYSATNWLTVGRRLPVFLVSCLDAVCLVAFDLVADPVAVKRGLWVWVDSGAYYGVPYSNFLGWFLVALTIALTCRTLCGVRPLEPYGLVPVVCFTALVANLCVDALAVGYSELAVLGLLSSAPFTLGPFLRWLRQGSRRLAV